MFDELEQRIERGRRDSLKVTALRTRVAEIVSQYEDQLAEFRADATVRLDDAQREIDNLKAELEELKNGLVQEEAPDANDADDPNVSGTDDED